jgi:hypothetical protein
LWPTVLIVFTREPVVPVPSFKLVFSDAQVRVQSRSLSLRLCSAALQPAVLNPRPDQGTEQRNSGQHLVRADDEDARHRDLQGRHQEPNGANEAWHEDASMDRLLELEQLPRKPKHSQEGKRDGTGVKERDKNIECQENHSSSIVTVIQRRTEPLRNYSLIC